MTFVLRNTETVPKPILRLIQGFGIIAGLMAVTFSVLAASFYSRHWIAFEESVALLTVQDCTVEVNGNPVEERDLFLSSISKIEQVHQRKSSVRRRFDVVLQSEAKSFHFQLWEDSQVPNEYRVMVFEMEPTPIRVGTIRSPELSGLLTKYDGTDFR